jgi:hypothetical protein
MVTPASPEISVAIRPMPNAFYGFVFGIVDSKV